MAEDQRAPRPGFAPSLGLICLPLLFLYVVTALPALGWRDNAEFADVAHTLGVAHPAGFPTYSLLYKVLTFLPLGSLPFRVNLGAALFAALALVVVYAIIHRWIRLDQSSGPAARTWAAAGATLVFGLTTTLWEDATQAEVYSLNIFLLATVMYAAFRWVEDGGEAWLAVGGLLYGLAAGNHGSIAFYVPGLLAYLFLHSRKDAGRRILIILLFFLIGFSVYLYLPLRAATNVPFDFGHPINWDRLVMHLTDQKDSNTHFAAVREGTKFWVNLWRFVSDTTPLAFWVLGLPLVLIGLARLWKTDRPLVVLITYVVGMDVIFFIEWIDTSNYLPAYFLVTLAGGAGAAELLTRWPAATTTRTGRLALGATMISFAAVAIGPNFTAHDRSKAFIPLESFRADFEALPPEAISVTGHQWFYQRAYQDVYRLREDVTATLSSDFIWPQWFNPVIPARFPSVIVPPDMTSGAEDGEVLKRFLRANLDVGRAIYLEPSPFSNEIFYPHLKPDLDFLLRVTPAPRTALTWDEAKALLARIQNRLTQEIESGQLWEEVDLHAHYTDLLFRYAVYFQKMEQPSAAIALLAFVENIFGPKGTNTLWTIHRVYIDGEIGNILLNTGRVPEAVARFQAAIALDPYDYASWANLGQIKIKQKEWEEARRLLERAVALDPKKPEAPYNLGELYRLRSDFPKARTWYGRALTVAEGTTIRQQIHKSLATLPPAGEASK